MCGCYQLSKIVLGPFENRLLAIARKSREKTVTNEGMLWCNRVTTELLLETNIGDKLVVTEEEYTMYTKPIESMARIHILFYSMYMAWISLNCVSESCETIQNGFVSLSHLKDSNSEKTENFFSSFSSLVRNTLNSMYTRIDIMDS